VWQLGNPTGNLDTGATYGAFIGLLLLGGIYAAVGTFASSLTDNQVVAFITAAVLCFISYEGFAALSEIAVSGTLQDVIAWCGIKQHYSSISRGVVDSRDLTYFLGVMALFLLLTRLKLQSRKWK
jgi:ABC-2 type transport system permease protein